MKKELKTSISSRIVESEITPGLKLFSLKTGAKRIVTVEGSLLGGSHHGTNKNWMLPEIVAEMLDQGTKKREKTELHNLLEDRGISIDWSVSRFFLHFSARCLSEDLGLTIELIAEMLRFPTFPTSELEVIKNRMIGDAKERNTDTRVRATEALARAMFNPDHPNYSINSEEQIALIEKTTVEDLTSFHKKLGTDNFNIVVAGDLQEATTLVIVQKNFAGLSKTEFKITNGEKSKIPTQKEVRIEMPDKTSTDVAVGMTLPFGDKGDEFYPFLLANAILGGGFTARLIQEVRDKQGLTYGVYSQLSGTGNDTPGYWYASATFAPELLERGVQALRKEMIRFIKAGVTQKELNEKKQTLIGGYKVALSTTRGIARILISNVEHGRPKEFIDLYPEVIKNISLKTTNEVIKNSLNEKNLVTVIAGTIQ
ncbi:MAG TPA: pitrilysin family protein [Candidatus Paceibacterota bacterium]